METGGYAASESSPPASKWPSNAEGYTLLSRIGHGAFATVYKAKVVSGPQADSDVAVKVIELEEFADSSLEEIRRELQMMKMCRHENVIAYHVAFPTKRQMWLVMPLLEGGSCAYVMRATKGSMGFEDESVIAYILREVAKAVKYFHDNMQIHRDLKAGNILLSLDARVFLSDFGVAAPLRDDKKRQTFVGTPCWMAPEVLEQTHGYDYKADIWSYGITGIELATGEAPYQRMHPLKVMKIIIEKEPPKANRKLSHLFLDLIEMCLQKDPKKRPTMEEVCARNAKFFRTADAEPLKKLLSRLPPLDQRIPPLPKAREEQVEEKPPREQWDFAVDDGDEFEGIGDTDS